MTTTSENPLHVDRDLTGLRVVAVHAHPDDEALWTGGALAQLAARGADVTVITATLGEEGEVIGETWAGLVADAADALGGLRIGELTASLSELGVRGRFLGRAGRYRDSGMAGSRAAAHPRAFVNAGEKAVADLVEDFRELRPHLVITYAPDGGYGHPDHIAAHRYTHLAAEQVDIPRIAWSLTDRSDLEDGLKAIEQVPDGWRRARDGELASRTDAEVTVELTDTDITAKVSAMRAHATQIWVADGTTSVTNPHAAHARVSDPGQVPFVYALSNLVAQPLSRREYYRIGAGLPVVGERGRVDLAAGLLE